MYIRIENFIFIIELFILLYIFYLILFMFTFLQKSSFNSDTVIYYMIQPFLRQCIQQFNLTDFNCSITVKTMHGFFVRQLLPQGDLKKACEDPRGV